VLKSEGYYLLVLLVAELPCGIKPQTAMDLRNGATSNPLTFLNASRFLAFGRYHAWQQQQQQQQQWQEQQQQQQQQQQKTSAAATVGAAMNVSVSGFGGQH